MTWRQRTLKEIHERLGSLGAEIDDLTSVITADHPKDAEGFPQIENQDLRDAITKLDEVSAILARLCMQLDHYC